MACAVPFISHQLVAYQQEVMCRNWGDTNLCRPHSLRQVLTVPVFQGWPAVQRPFNIKAHAELGEEDHMQHCVPSLAVKERS